MYMLFLYFRSTIPVLWKYSTFHNDLWYIIFLHKESQDQVGQSSLKKKKYNVMSVFFFLNVYIHLLANYYYYFSVS